MTATTSNEMVDDVQNVSQDEFEKFDGIDFDPAELKRIKAMMNFGQRKITKKYVTKAKKASRNKMQKASRKRNRK